MTSSDTALSLSQVCQGPISWRIQSAGRLLAQTSAKEVVPVLRTLIQSVFGAAGPAEPGVLGWGIQIFTKSQNPLEFDQLVNFLGPQGPLVSMVLKHATDPSILFEFPIACLPAKTQSDIHDGTAAPFYAGRVHSPALGKPPVTILLNSLEFYLFHFCYYLVHVGEGCGGLSWTCVGDSVYPTLLEDYLFTFLPCNGSTPPVPPHQAPHSPAARLASSGLQQLSNLMSLSPSQQEPYTALPAMYLHTAYVSQTVAQVIVEMFINQCQPSVGRVGTRQGLGASVMSEHIRGVRMIIKHLHFFSSSIKPAQPSPLDALRRSVWPQYRSSFYQLFLQLLQHWPLDSSFRLLLEAWLSYIQPWRYTNINRSHLESNDIVSWPWQRFVADNLLLYSGVMMAVLPRLMRLDLSASRNAHMLYRICKVLSQSHLPALLQATEDAIYSTTPSSVPPASTAVVSPDGRPPVHAVAMAVRAHIMDMETSSYVYTPMFGHHAQQMVWELLVNVRTAEAAVQAELEATQPQARGEGTIATVLRWFDDSSNKTDTAREELLRAALHLQTSAGHLVSLYQVADTSVDCNSNSSSPSKRAPTVPDQIQTDNGPVLSDHGRRQMLSGLRRKDLRYEGDPDLRPIALGEFTCLVRLLYTVACFLNTKYSEAVQRGYYSTGVDGIAWRCVLQSPCTVLEYDKGRCVTTDVCGASYPTRRARQLPPRLSFRRAANRQLVAWLVAVCVVLQLLGLSLPWQILYLGVPAVIIYFGTQLILKPALMTPPTQQDT